MSQASEEIIRAINIASRLMEWHKLAKKDSEDFLISARRFNQL